MILKTPTSLWWIKKIMMIAQSQTRQCFIAQEMIKSNFNLGLITSYAVGHLTNVKWE
ncbi:hypothetical protein NC651_018648 [Populus alba x Populus x berolinensis]|nr:hypothetical protein NC651_018648 [Populus alba x Populus x berolinensis]